MPGALANSPAVVATSAAPRLLVVTDVSLSSGDPGAIFLRALLSGYPSERLALCEVTATPTAVPQELTGVATKHVRRPREVGLRRFGDVTRRLSRRPIEWRLRRTEVPRVVREAVAFGRAERVEAALVVLNGTTTIVSATSIAAGLRVPLYTLAWDPPAYRLADAWGLRGSLLSGYLHDFDDALRASTRTAVMSETMRDEFERRYGVETVLMRLGVAREKWRTRDARDVESDFVIGYAGSLYARAEWNALLDALDLVNWRLGERAVRVRVLSGAFDARASGPVRFEFLGWRSTDDTLALLAATDLCYLPYWFAPRYDEVVRMSFPSKLSSYVAAGAPVFYHGPERSSPTAFLRRFPVGTCCHSLEPAEIARQLEACASDPEFRQRAVAAGRRALEEELGLHVFHRRLAELVGAPVEALVAGGAR